MTKKKYSLDFVKNGNPFVMPKWTTKKHKAALVQMNKECDGMSDEEKNDEFNYYIIFQTLKQIDPSVEISKIREMHPEDIIALFDAVYNEGRQGIYFQEGEKPKQRKKSTGKKK